MLPASFVLEKPLEQIQTLQDPTISATDVTIYQHCLTAEQCAHTGFIHHSILTSMQAHQNASFFFLEKTNGSILKAV